MKKEEGKSKVNSRQHKSKGNSSQDKSKAKSRQVKSTASSRHKINPNSRDKARRGTYCSHSKRQHHHDCEVVARINKLNIDISGGVHDGKEDLEVSAGDQIIMIEYANDGTEDTVTDVRKVSINDGCDQTTRLR